jgi:N-methylhydantoinase A
MSASRWRVGIDIGGTFTDVVGMEIGSGKIHVTKVPSIPSDPSRAVEKGLQTLFADFSDIQPSNVDFFAHGTTVATNAIIEGKGAKSGLFITKGFNAIYDLRGGHRPKGSDRIDPQYNKPLGLVPPRLTAEIGGRIAFDGSELEALDEDAVRVAARRLRNEKVTSVAVCYIFSFMDPSHEKRTAEIIREEYPECRVSLSCLVLPVIREYLRLSTTVLDAYVGPVVATYLKNISHCLRENQVETKRLFIMQSNGGLMQIDLAANYPNQTLLSGPAAGVVFGTDLGKLLNEPNIVTFDVGGTSTDIAVLSNGSYQETRQGKIHDQDIGTPMIQIRTLGAGGGTIARIGPDGRLKCGPQSAGADPGPACYGLGGTEPTVTDANIVLGCLNDKNFIGGRFQIDPALSEKAINEKIAKPLGLTLQQAALGIIRVVCVNIEVDLRMAFMERGLDPANFSLLAFGGGGPVLATRVARDMKIPRVIVPPHPGISCAMGLLQTDVRHFYLQTRMGSLEAVNPDELNSLFLQLEERARKESEQEGFDRSSLKLQRQLDLRYPFQGYELTIDCQNDPLKKSDYQKIRTDFDGMHKEVYGTSASGEIPEIVNIRVMSIAGVDKLNLARLEKSASKPEPKGRRPVLFDDAEGYLDTPIFERSVLKAGDVMQGPAVIEQLDSTILIFPDQSAIVESHGSLIIKTA